MKILLLLDSLAVGGGAERIATILGGELHQKGHEIHYLTFLDKNPKYKFKGVYHTLNLDQTSKSILKRGVEFLQNSRRIKNICQELQVEMIISVGEVANLHAVLSRLLFRNKTRIIISQHINPQIHMDSKLKVRIMNFFYSRADKTVCVSKGTEKILNKDFGIENTLTIYNMLDIDENIKLSQEELPQDSKKLFMNGLEDGGFNFINIGSLFRQKGHWFLIRSFKKVVEKYPDVKLFILGEGDLRRKLENLIIKTHLKENVVLLGNKENVFPFLKNSNCFIFSSLWEGFPMTLIEALSMNIPVISADCKTGPREALCPELGLEEDLEYPYFGEYGILNQPFPNKLIFQCPKEVPLIKPEELLAGVMIRVIEDFDLRKKYSNGLEIAKNFDKDNIILQWEKLILIVSNY